MNKRCRKCKGTGAVQKDGKDIGNGQSYTLVCPDCQGVGHFRDHAAEAAAWDSAA